LEANPQTTERMAPSSLCGRAKTKKARREDGKQLAMVGKGSKENGLTPNSHSYATGLIVGINHLPLRMNGLGKRRRIQH
jgi:hypothetical protein